MPHDAKGHPVEVGDHVILHATILEITSGAETYCNLLVRADEKMAPDAEPWDCCLSARMVERVERVPVIPEAFTTSG